LVTEGQKGDYWKLLYEKSEKHILELRKLNEIEKQDLIYQQDKILKGYRQQLELSAEAKSMLEGELLGTSEALKKCQGLLANSVEEQEITVSEYKGLVSALKSRLEEVYSHEHQQ
jgi:hypothetical protein